MTLLPPREPMPSPLSDHGDRDLAARLMHEHGMDPEEAVPFDPEMIECLAARGVLATADLWLEDRQWRAQLLAPGG